MVTAWLGSGILKSCMLTKKERQQQQACESFIPLKGILQKKRSQPKILVNSTDLLVNTLTVFIGGRGVSSW